MCGIWKSVIGLGQYKRKISPGSGSGKIQVEVGWG
jgi:hypothetical protein